MSVRQLIENRIRELWVSGCDEGLSSSFPKVWCGTAVSCEQGADYGYVIQHAKLGNIRLHRKKLDPSFDRVLRLMSDRELLSWLERLLCQKYR